jgi:predicted peptidase
LTLIPQTVEINGYSIPYTVYVPNVANTKGLPILLFLHGRTEQVTERQALTHSGIGLNLQNHPDHFPAVIVMPQATPDGFWDSVKTIDQKNPNSPTLEQLAMKALDETMTAYESDPTRVYLTGNSMGGYGSWKLGSDFPDRFAAIMPEH